MKRDYGVFFLVLCIASLNLSWGRRVQLLESAGREFGVSKDSDIVYEDGFVVQTILDDKKINVSIYSTFPVPGKDFLYALDSHASQVLKIKLRLKSESVIGQVAGSEDGEAGHKDGWGKYALFNHPENLAVDDDGNVYVADVRDCVIRKIDPEGVVTTIAGESKVSGLADGEGRNARFSADFSITYLSSLCSLLVSDRGNRRLRLIQLKATDACEIRNGMSFSLGLEGLFFVVALTMVVSTVAVLTLKNARLRERLAGLQLYTRLMWRCGGDLYTSLQNGGIAQLANGRNPPLHTASLPANLGSRQPDLIDFAIDSPAANRPHHTAYVLDGENSCIGPDGAYSPSAGGVLAYTQSAPASLDYNQDDLEDDQRLVRHSETRGRTEQQ